MYILCPNRIFIIFLGNFYSRRAGVAGPLATPLVTCQNIEHIVMSLTIVNTAAIPSWCNKDIRDSTILLNVEEHKVRFTLGKWFAVLSNSKIALTHIMLVSSAVTTTPSTFNCRFLPKTQMSDFGCPPMQQTASYVSLILLFRHFLEALFC